jgi:phospholipid-binding lipoprotein MlaA
VLTNDRLRAILRLTLFAAPLFISGCATPPPASDTADYQAYQQQNDPAEPTNRVFYNINDKIDRYAFKPLAKGYIAITSQSVRTHVGDFVTNVGEPGRLVYFAAGGKPRDAGTALVRFVVNSTVGIAGIFDPATGLGYPETDTDFGLTLAEWGIPAGPYLYLPVFGPSGARDVYLDPIDQIEETALDPYATFRSLYRQSRASQLQLIDQRDTPSVPDWFPQSPSAAH